MSLCSGALFTSISSSLMTKVPKIFSVSNWFHFTPQRRCPPSRPGTKPFSANGNCTRAHKDKQFCLIPLPLPFSELHSSCPDLKVIQRPLQPPPVSSCMLLIWGRWALPPGAAHCLTGRGDLSLPHHQGFSLCLHPRPPFPCTWGVQF